MYVKITNGTVDQYPYTVGQLRRDNPNVSFPRTIPDATLQSYGVYSVTEADKPSGDARTKNITKNATPTLVNNAWVVGWTTTDKTSDEVTEYDNAAADANRDKRNGLLAETDYFALTDVTMSGEMTTYRQALRDITSHANWPHLSDSDWPTKP